jgi:hypothetical protein
MKTKKRISKLFATSIMAVASVASSYGQSNLGSACGCPAVASRPSVLLSALPGFTAVAGTYGGELTNGAVLTCANNYIIDQKIYIPSGKTLTINPGTVLKGRVTANDPATGLPDKAKATALVIERGGKIMAEGSADCQIVFTAEADPLDGTFPIANKGQWGGVLLLGKAYNNLLFAGNGPFVAGGSGKLAVADGLGTIEGFATSNVQDRYGVNTSAAVIPGELSSQSFDDNDNSGVMKYVSIRYSGALLSVGAEINGLTLASVGRATTIDHIEIVSCADDNIEIFGGTVNLKYITTLFGNDDMFDWDLGWTGKTQFFFGMKTDNTASVDSDNGIEADSDDNKIIGNLNTGLRRSTPVIYNATILGNEKSTLLNSSTEGSAIYGDNSSLAAINAKELTGGEIYNSVFANFKNGLNLIKSIGTVRTGTSESYHNWSSTLGNGSEILKVKCNTFVGCTNPLTLSNAATAVAADNTQFTTTDLNVIVAGNTLPGFDYAFAVNNTTNVFSDKYDAVPNPALSVVGCPVAPADGFFKVANYRGAFASTGDNWLSDWSYSQVLGATKGLVACPTDLDKDGDTDIDDFQLFAPAFGYSCN